MGVSVIQLQRDIILSAIRRTAKGEWKVLVVDTASKRLVDNVVKEDDILHENVTHVERIEDRRPANPDTDAIYLLSVQAHIVDCVLADLDRRRYRRSHLLWTGYLDPRLRRKIDSMPTACEQIASSDILSIDYFPRESHLVTFRDPWSFPVLFHPGCNNLVRTHLQDLARKILALCVSMGELPLIRYYRPREASHEAGVLCTHLARFVQDEFDSYVQYHPEFPPPANRPRSAMYITDRSMDLHTPLVHEFTYQAMAHDLLPIQDGDRVTFRTSSSANPKQGEKDVEISENDAIWVENRHRHMKDTIEKLMSDFKRFLDENPHFANSGGDGKNATSLNAIKDMLAGLPQFQELKEAYSLHLTMAQELMNLFQSHKLADLASVEQSLATGLDEQHRKPKNLAEQLIRLLDDEDIVPPDRLRLIILYLLYRDGLVPVDTQKLLAHAQLSQQDQGLIDNLELLGARVRRSLKDRQAAAPSLFDQKRASTEQGDGYALSRFSPALKSMLEQHIGGTLDLNIFPYANPPAEAHIDQSNLNGIVSQASLRSAKPTWAKSRLAAVEPRQRIIVVMAGGATYAESRACYEVSQAGSRDVFLATSHMLTPALFLRQIGDLGVDRRRLGLPLDQPPLQPPRHLFEPEPPSQLPPSANEPAPAGPVASGKGTAGTSTLATAAALGAMKLNSKDGDSVATNGAASHHLQPAGTTSRPPGQTSKPPEKEKSGKKKKHHFFSSKK